MHQTLWHRTTAAIAAAATLVLLASSAHGLNARLIRKLDTDNHRVQLDGVEGKGEEGVLKAARAAALDFAGQSLTGDDKEKAAVARYVAGHNAQLVGHTANPRVLRRVFSDDGERISAKVNVDVNVTALRKALEAAKVLTPVQALAKKVGNPTLLILSSEQVGKGPEVELTARGQIVADRIAAELASRKWNLVDKAAVAAARKRQEAVQSVQGMLPDLAAQIAGLAGADIYIAFTVAMASTGVQAEVSLKAHDTATGALIASAAGSSRQYIPGSPEAKAINEGLGKALPKLLELLSGHWHEVAKVGRRYKIIVRADFADRSSYRRVRDALEDLGEWDKTLKTDLTLAGVLTSPDDPDDLADDLIDELRDAGLKGAKFSVESRSLFILEVTP
jgi:hypothetical protein